MFGNRIAIIENGFKIAGTYRYQINLDEFPISSGLIYTTAQSG